MLNKNLLVIAPNFPNEDNTTCGCVYIKEQLNFIKSHFDNIYVIIPTPFVPSFFKILPFIKKTWISFLDKKDYDYYNIHVIFSRFFVIPNTSEEDVIKKMFQSIKKTIEKNQIKFDIIHAHFTNPTGHLGVLTKTTYQKPLVLTVHEDANWLKDEMKDESCVSVWKNADAIIRVNENDIYRFYEKGIEKIRVKYIPNGYDHKTFKKIKKSIARRILNLSPNKKIILNIGTLEERKGQKLIINVIKYLNDKYDDLQLMIIGKGPLKSEIEEIIISNHLKNSVFLLGSDKKREEIPIWLNACDIFVLSSYSEGNPTVMFEAIGCGTPYIGSDVGGSSSIIKNKNIGMLFKAGDTEDMKIKIEKAITKKWNREKIKKYSEKYSWKLISLQIKGVYSEVMK